MARSLPSKICYPVPLSIVLDSNGVVIAVNARKFDTQDNFEDDTSGQVDIIQTSTVEYLRRNLYDQLSSFHNTDGSVKDRTVGSPSGSPTGQYLAGYSRTYESGTVSFEKYFWATPTKSIPIGSSCVTKTNGTQRFTTWLWPEDICKSIFGRLVFGNRWYHFNGKDRVHLIGIAKSNSSFTPFSFLNAKVLDTLTPGSTGCMIQGAHLYFDTSWEESEYVKPWKRFQVGSNYITFKGARVVDQKANIFYLTGCTITANITAGTEVYWSSSTSLPLEELSPIYTYQRGHEIDFQLLKTPDNKVPNYTYGIIKMEGSQGYYPPARYLALASHPTGALDNEFSWNVGLTQSAQQTIVSAIVSPAVVLLEKFGDILSSNVELRNDFTRSLEEPDINHTRYTEIYGTYGNKILSDLFKQYTLKRTLTDIDLIAIRSLVIGYRDTFVWETLNRTYCPADIAAVNNSVFGNNPVCIIDRSNGSLNWYAAGKAIIDGNLSTDNRILSFIPRDRDGNKFPVYTEGFNLALNKKSGSIRYGMAPNVENWTPPSGALQGYRGAIQIKQDPQTIVNHNGFSIGVRGANQSWGSPIGLGLWSKDSAASSVVQNCPSVYTDTVSHWRQTVKNDGVMSTAPKGVNSQTLTGTYGGVVGGQQAVFVGGGSSVLLRRFSTGVPGGSFVQQNESSNYNQDKVEQTTVRCIQIDQLGNPLIGVNVEIHGYSTYNHSQLVHYPEAEAEGDYGATQPLDQELDYSGCWVEVAGQRFDIKFQTGTAEYGYKPPHYDGSLNWQRFATFVAGGNEDIVIKYFNKSPPTPPDPVTVTDNNGYVTGGWSGLSVSWQMVVRICPVYAGNQHLYTTDSFHQMISYHVLSPPRDEEDAEEQRVVDIIRPSTHQAYEASSQFVLSGPADDIITGGSLAIPQQLILPEKFDSPAVWFGPNCLLDFNNSSFCKLVKLSNGRYTTISESAFTLHGTRASFHLRVPLKPGQSKQFYHLGGSVYKVISVREQGSGDKLGTISGSGDFFTFTAGPQCGFDTLIAYDSTNNIGATIEIIVTDNICGVLPDLPSVSEIKYFKCDRYQALDPSKCPLRLTKNIAIGTFSYQQTNGKIILPDGSEQFFATRTAGIEPSFTSAGMFAVTQEGEHSADLDYIGDPGRTTLKFTGVKITANKQVLNVTDSSGDGIVFTNAQRVKWEPQLGEYLSNVTSGSESTHIVCEVNDTRVIWNKINDYTWGLEIPAGWTPPVVNGTIYPNCCIAKLNNEFCYAISSPFTINVIPSSSGSGNASNASTAGGSNSNASSINSNLANGELFILDFGDITYEQG